MGVVVNVRKSFHRIGLWTRSAGKSTKSEPESKQVLERIGLNFKNVLMIKESEPVEFMGHADSAHSGSTRAKVKFTV